MKNILFTFILSLCSSCFATEQIKDVLTVGEGSYHIQEVPLNQLIEHDELSAILKQQMCTASWRGYKASWELKDGLLWLKHIRMNPCSDTYESIDASILFKEKEYPIKASWYNGKIILPVGETKYIMRDGFDEDNWRDGDLIGYDQEAFVFNFVKGRLESKGVELIQKRY